MSWHVYFLRDPCDGEVRYVGCSSSPTARLISHLKGRNSSTREWILSLRKKGLFPSFVPVTQHFEKSKALRKELFHTRNLTDRGVILLNKNGTGIKQKRGPSRCQLCGQIKERKST